MLRIRLQSSARAVCVLTTEPSLQLQEQFFKLNKQHRLGKQASQFPSSILSCTGDGKLPKTEHYEQRLRTGLQLEPYSCQSRWIETDIVNSYDIHLYLSLSSLPFTLSRMNPRSRGGIKRCVPRKGHRAVCMLPSAPCFWTLGFYTKWRDTIHFLLP